MNADAIGMTPILEVTVDGQPVAGAFYSRLVVARLRDNEGQEADTFSCDLDDRDNAIALPRKGATLAVQIGYRETGLFDKGAFKLESVAIIGSVRGGELIRLSAKAADLRKDVKAEGAKAYEQKTVKEIIEAEAKAMGLPAIIDDAIGAIQIPYRLRLDQSHIDFVTALADEVGGIVKPAGGKLVVQKRGSGKSAGGQPLEPITIYRSDCSEWSIEPDGRMQYGRVEAHWTDPETGERRVHREPTGLDGPPFVVREPFQDRRTAETGAKAETGRLNRQTGNGRFTMYGRPGAQAGAPVQLFDFRSGAEGEWRAATVEHVFEPGPNGGYTTEIEIKAKEDGKSAKEE
jgi:hypothetical protein